MSLITAVRSQVPGQMASPPTRPEVAPRMHAVDARPVAPPDLKESPGQPAATAAAIATRLAERDESDHPAAEARAAAEAARTAYIKASLAAGVSPLPLP